MRIPAILTSLMTLALLLTAACGGGGAAGGIIAIDGSSTVFPITEAVAEEFQKVNPARVTIGVSGTGGGFKKFCSGEIAITGASRPIKPTEIELCAAKGIDYIELPVAYDGIAVVVHPANGWVDQLTVEELKALWQPEAQAQVMRWSQIREGWPDEEVHLFGPGVDSGTFDYFTKAIVGEEHASRGDFTSSEDDNVLVQGISTDRLALGFFGYAYYADNDDKLKLVPVDDGDQGNGAGPIAASPTTVADGTYQPLSRPIFIYVAKAAAERPEVQAFVDFYLQNATGLVEEVGYIALPKRAYGLVSERFVNRVTGSLFAASGSKVGVTVEDLLVGN
ncbi:MAG: PstS family phosphate ABC transporter substrate-binding protein [Acidobacteria bacterium]|nr:PstS family phosphate ABC transporter substrate-binding protein [Acidobacteriota bacterium]